MTAENKLVEIERDQLHRWAHRINEKEISQLAQQIYEERESAPWRALLEDMRLLEQVASRETNGLAMAVTRLAAALSIVKTVGNASSRKVVLSETGLASR